MGLEELKKSLSKVKGARVDILSQSDVAASKEWLGTPAYDMNRILSGNLNKGIPNRTFSLFIGPETCLDENTFVHYSIFNKESGKLVNKKGGKIKTLFKRFHSEQDKVFKIISINENDCGFRNDIIDVVKTGRQECYSLTTENNFFIITTKKHRFYVGNGEYLRLEDLKVGDNIYTYKNYRNKKSNKQKFKNYKEIMVKYHPFSTIKSVDRYTYYRVKRCNFVYEANLNNMTFDEYRNYLNTQSKNDIKKLKFIDKSKYEIHHIDKDTFNDDLSNLLLMNIKDHHRMHAVEHIDYLNFISLPEKIKSIKRIGERETYDIKCLSPYNNYIANNIVVHNSGKSSFMALCLAEAQKNGYKLVVIDTEGGWDEDFVGRWGIDPDGIIHVYTPWIDQICMILGNIIDSDEEKMIIALDSIGGIERKKLLNDSLEGSVKADQGTLQKEIKRMLKMLLNICKSKKSIALAAGHYYGNPSGYGEADQVGGGKFVKLAPDIIISLKKQKLFENPNGKTVKERGKVIGNIIKAITLKNRYYPPFQEATLEIDFNKGINKYAGLMELLINAKLIKVGGSWYTFPDDQKVQGIINATKLLENHPSILKDLEKWLESTGYSSTNEIIAEAMEVVNEKNKEKGENGV